ncbi:U11/U12 small nuclear ribonucleoprotein 65 kDa protein [Sarcoptes scabiei]|uniref:RNA-binding protein 40 n=1 Tax=Sarcoptes scabiei TaxID=52283 RepID=A0A834RA05_SARSC|nr:U11/U12 small nuclear ribonucleoprotein 65 kDa protein [Sarcoptes scabiei]
MDLALKISNFTPKFSYQNRNEMLYGLGASTVHNYPFHSIVYFPDHLHCHTALRLLHQRILNRKRLKVVYVREQEIDTLPVHQLCDSSLKRKIQQDQYAAFRKRFDELNSSERIKKNLSKILSANLLFDFPAIDESILNRINHYLWTDYDFYHHVLLLMIHFGFDPPFDPKPTNSNSPVINEEDWCDMEIETECHDLNLDLATQFQLKKRKRKHKKLKIGPASQGFDTKTKERSDDISSVNIDSIFDSEKTLKSKSLKISILTKSNTITETAQTSQIESDTKTDGFGMLQPIQESESVAHKTPNIRDNSFDIFLLSKQNLIPIEKIKQNQVSQNDWHKYSVFKNYLIGDESHRLYVKNINKTIKLEDLYYLFANFVDLDNDNHLNNFGIVYMEKGRMRGQAFVTYPEKSQAKAALIATNGYQFVPNKPIVVAFGRSCQ